MKSNYCRCLMWVNRRGQGNNLQKKFISLLDCNMTLLWKGKGGKPTFLKGVTPQGLSSCSGSPDIIKRPAGSDWTCTCIRQEQTHFRNLRVNKTFDSLEGGMHETNIKRDSFSFILGKRDQPNFGTKKKKRKEKETYSKIKTKKYCTAKVQTTNLSVATR